MQARKSFRIGSRFHASIRTINQANDVPITYSRGGNLDQTRSRCHDPVQICQRIGFAPTLSVRSIHASLLCDQLAENDFHGFMVPCHRSVRPGSVTCAVRALVCRFVDGVVMRHARGRTRGLGLADDGTASNTRPSVASGNDTFDHFGAVRHCTAPDVHRIALVHGRIVAVRIHRVAADRMVHAGRCAGRKIVFRRTRNGETLSRLHRIPRTRVSFDSLCVVTHGRMCTLLPLAHRRGAAAGHRMMANGLVHHRCSKSHKIVRGQHAQRFVIGRDGQMADF